MLMSTTTVIRIEGYGDGDTVFSGFGCLYCSFVFVMTRYTCIS